MFDCGNAEGIRFPKGLRLVQHHPVSDPVPVPPAVTIPDGRTPTDNHPHPPSPPVNGSGAIAGKTDQTPQSSPHAESALGQTPHR